MQEKLNRFAHAVTTFVGSPYAFVAALLVTLLWLVSGPFFGFDTRWNFLANTTTTVITFLMVFLIQSTQNRETKALHLKIDELLRAIPDARGELARLSKVSNERLREVEAELEGRE
jgi:low affinity Fe/Cu permease